LQFGLHNNEGLTVGGNGRGAGNANICRYMQQLRHQTINGTIALIGMNARENPAPDCSGSFENETLTR
jgi:hypothetical protein